MSQDAHLRVTGRATEDHSVPGDVLVRVIQGVQQSLWLLAAAKELRTLRQRFKPDQSFRQQYTLRVAVAEAGSYAMPVRLVDERPQAIFEEDATEGLFDQLAGVWHAIATADLATARDIVKDEGYFLRLMQEFHRSLPRRGDGWSMTLRAAPNSSEVRLGARERPTVERWLESPEEHREMSVIGELQRIDFAEKRLWILYPPTQREIECSYRDELEDSIVDARRGLFQVTGQFVLDSDGHPKRLTDVRSIESVDLSPVKLTDVDVNSSTFVFSPPIVLKPELDPEEQQHFVATVREFGFTLSGRTRDALMQDFSEQVAFAWSEYALANEGDLTDDARRLQSLLRKHIQPGQHGPS
jgi:hypothetical protein